MDLRFSDEMINRGITLIDNVFFTDYMPYMSENVLKCYLYAQLLVNKNSANKEEQLQSVLGCDGDELVKYFDELQDMGLVIMRQTQPIVAEFTSLSGDRFRVKKFNKEKHSDFVTTLQTLFVERQLLPNEIIKYIELIEECRISPEAMVMVAAHCLRIKGNKVPANYILTVAKAWAAEGVNSPDKVEEHLKTLEANNENLRKIFCEMGIKSTPDFDDKQLYIKWTSSWGYDIDCLVAAASHLKKKGGTAKFDSHLDKLYRSGIFTLHDIKEYHDYHKRATAIAKEVSATLGLYYQNTDIIVSTYISEWINKGFESTAITAVASYCFKRSVRTLEGMEVVMNKFYSGGHTTLAAINNYIDNAISADKEIGNLLSKAGSPRTVRETDRKFYQMWSNVWGFSYDIMSHAAELASGKMQPTAYMNVLLSKWHQENRHTLEAVAASTPPASTDEHGKKTKKGTTEHNARFDGERQYTKQELDSIFDSLSNIDDLLN